MDVIAPAAAATRLGVPVNRVRQWVRDGALVLAVGDDGARGVPVQFLADDGPVKGLPAVITLLRDAGYRDEEVVEWLFREDDSLPGAPIAALQADRGTEVKRRAQASGF